MHRSGGGIVHPVRACRERNCLCLLRAHRRDRLVRKNDTSTLWSGHGSQANEEWTSDYERTGRNVNSRRLFHNELSRTKNLQERGTR